MTAMEEAMMDEINYFKKCLRKLEEGQGQGPDKETTAWMRGYYKGNIAAYKCALKLYDIQKKKEEKQ